jgi:3-deoxy-7-phosphoheptulonate synthase
MKQENLITPEVLKKLLPLEESLRVRIDNCRGEVKNALNSGKRMLIITGPCSIHNLEEALEYAERLNKLQEKVKDKILILMRVYLEKPRTTVGWKGFINDPDLNSTNDIEKGLKEGRRLLLEINRLIGVATEFLDPLVCPYISDLVSFGAVGARTTESQIHRQIISGLDMVCGFKNSTSGSMISAINSIISAGNSHTFIGISDRGFVSKIFTDGNRECHLILRGGDSGPNYEDVFIIELEGRLREKGLERGVIVDCSHGNSGGDYRNQRIVFEDVIRQSKDINVIKGLMLESNLEEGKQKSGENLKRGVSVTDSCIGWKETEEIILMAYDKI